jgi:hypothetical protein
LQLINFIGDHVDVTVDEEDFTMNWKIEKMSLTPDELDKTYMIDEARDYNKMMEEYYEFSNKPRKFQFVHKIPQDAFLVNSEGSTVERNDRDTELGALVEIMLPRRRNRVTFI